MGKADDDDYGIRDQVADHRQQANDEGQGNHGLCQRQMDAEQGQQHGEIERGENGIDGRNAHLGEDDATKRIGQTARALGQHRSQRLRDPLATDFAQGEQGADDEADQHMRRHDSCFLADRLHLTRMFAQPLHTGGLGAFDAVGQGADQPGGQGMA